MEGGYLGKIVNLFYNILYIAPFIHPVGNLDHEESHHFYCGHGKEFMFKELLQKCTAIVLFK